MRTVDSNYNPTVMLSEVQLAARWGISPKTLRNWRVSGGGEIGFVRIGRLVRYRLDDVIAHEAAHLIVSTSDQGRRS